MKKMNYSSISYIMIVLAILGTAFGCSKTSTEMLKNESKQPLQEQGPTYTIGTYSEMTFSPTRDIVTKNFKSPEELEKFIKQNRAGAYQGYYMFGRNERYALSAAIDMGTVTKEATQSPLDVSESSAQKGASSYSLTNNQVANIDEADIIKTDGEYIYTISNNIVYIIKAYPGKDAEITSTISIKDAYPESIFIKGKYLAVFGNYYNLDFFRESDFTPRGGVSFFNIYDISDHENPKLLKEYKFEGNYFNARMKDEFVYFVVRSYPEVRPLPMPYIWEGTVKKQVPIEKVHYYDIYYRSPQFVTVHAIDITKPNDEINSKSVAVEDSQNMYMSENAIYLTYTQWISEWEIRQEIINEILRDKITNSDKMLIEKIKATDDDILSQYEKQQKINSIYNRYMELLPQKELEELNDLVEEKLEERLEELEYLEFTIINKISVKGNRIDVEKNGKVPGHIINQFSMDEHGEIFRIATTISQRWNTYTTKLNKMIESTNNVYALNKDMIVVGKLEGMAEGEQIYSTRFIGDRLYMVTFRQVDPFFVIDLSKPDDIRMLGKLKIPGFSRYLHPYDDNTIIGIGQETTTQGTIKGLKISLFDVRDVENPKEIVKFVTEERYAQSTALWEHKAFLFDKEKELLVIPAYSSEWDYRGGSFVSGYNGAFVFKITKDEIMLRGLIDHSSETGQPYYYQPMVERSLWINELLYTKSPTLLRINNISDLSSVKSIKLKATPENIPVY